MASHVPAHISLVGIGTTVDPNGSQTMEDVAHDIFVIKGGKMNQLTQSRGEDLVSELTLKGQRYLAYKVTPQLPFLGYFLIRECGQAIPIDVALIRATTADYDGNLSLEHESLLCDQRNLAMVCVTLFLFPLCDTFSHLHHFSLPQRRRETAAEWSSPK